MSKTSLRIAVLISGGGTTLHNLLQFQSQVDCCFETTLVISSSPNAGGMAFAKDANIPCHIVKKEKNDAGELFSETIFSLCRQHDIQLVVMGGFLKHLMIPDDFADRVINIHPSLIPAFSGQGFYGDRVHQAVLDYGCKVSGCTVHFVDNQFDHGPIISQQTVDVVEGDDAQQLQKRIFAQECHLYPRVVQAFALGDVKREGRWVWITLPDSK